MALMSHTDTGAGEPPIVFVHGFCCARSDWDAQVAHFSPRHRCIALDLRGHGATPGAASDATIERLGADVAELMTALDLPPAVLVGHSMGCRVVMEAALQAPARAAGVVLVDGSQFAPEMGAGLRALFATPAGFSTVTGRWFEDMFTRKSNPAVVAAALARASRMDRATRLDASLKSLRVPLLAIQSTWSNDKRERRPMQVGQSTPYLAMLRAAVPSVGIEIVPDTGHFPQIDEGVAVNDAMARFLARLS
jgi:pimeloyl-ACP methyl ester carboxylesterase